MFPQLTETVSQVMTTLPDDKAAGPPASAHLLGGGNSHGGHNGFAAVNGGAWAPQTDGGPLDALQRALLADETVAYAQLERDFPAEPLLAVAATFGHTGMRAMQRHLDTLAACAPAYAAAGGAAGDRRRRNLSPHATRVLTRWMQEHAATPYPSEEQKVRCNAMGGRWCGGGWRKGSRCRPQRPSWRTAPGSRTTRCATGSTTSEAGKPRPSLPRPLCSPRTYKHTLTL
jgi:hypothetical protein